MRLLRRRPRLPGRLVTARHPNLRHERQPEPAVRLIPHHRRDQKPGVVEGAPLAALTPRTLTPHNTHSTGQYVLDCGHPQDDPTYWCPNGDLTVCTDCCPHCTPGGAA